MGFWRQFLPRSAALGVTRRQPWAAPKRRTDGAGRGAGMWGQQYARWSLSGCAWRPACCLVPAVACARTRCSRDGQTLLRSLSACPARPARMHNKCSVRFHCSGCALAHCPTIRLRCKASSRGGGAAIVLDHPSVVLNARCRAHADGPLRCKARNESFMASLMKS